MNEDTEKDRPPKNAKAIVGKSIVIVGDVSGEEDLIINGAIEGDINFRENSVIIGKTGQVKANVTAKNIVIGGDMKGELRASEQVTIKPSGRVVGNIHASHVVLDEGCQFKGSVDMEDMNTASDSKTPKLRLPKNTPSQHIQSRPLKSR